jgi:hypothetical protein
VSPELVKARWAQLRGLLGALALVLVAGAIAAGVLVAIGGSDDAVEPGRIAAAAADPTAGDPFAYSDDRRREFERDATLGNSHVLYDKSPGGVLATARRVAAYRQRIERAAAAHDVDPDLMEAIVFLESAGRSQVIAGEDPEAASGLAQIVASTGTDLLGMRVDLERSRRLTEAIARGETEIPKLAERIRRAKSAKAARKLRAEVARTRKRVADAYRERAQVDERFDPVRALDGMGRYLEIAEGRFGATDLAVTSYHMGIGNLESVIDRYVSPADTSGTTAEIVARNDISYAKLNFDSSPLRNPRTWALLGSFGDDSSTYLWRVLAAERIMKLWRTNRPELADTTALQTAKSTQEEVFHPEGSTEVFATADDVAAATDAGDLVSIPPGGHYGYEVGPQLGELARELGVERSTYRALRPEALATLIYIGARVREIDGGKGALILTSAVRDLDYQRALVGVNSEATPNYSLHTTGYSFDILRRYRSDKQAEAFQFVLDRLRSLGVIDYAYEPTAIHVTVSDEARALLSD